ncbi:MAG: GAF domain-containing protein, partial [Deltaproteobacteria bacterium]|nr:GAF domain-containing protein [Deltaproteobacteria bacterium]
MYMESNRENQGGTKGIGFGRNAPSIPGLEIIEHIGSGAHSVVYRARRGGRDFAVKIQKEPRANLERTTDAFSRFRREGALLACLRHDGLPSIADLGETEGRQFIVMELVRGRTLSEQIAEGPLAEPDIIALAMRLASALGEVHRVGMVHCDVKPDNILVHEEDGARLIDFGFAVRASRDRPHEEIAGTLLYAAPEQTGMIKRPIDPRSDLYALGVVMYECATGRPPFNSPDLGELIRLHAVASPPDIRTLNPDISRGLAMVIGKLLSKDPDDRYQGHVSLMADLARLDEINEAIETESNVVVLGASDRLLSAGAEGKLIGRDAEFDEVVRLYKHAVQGKGCIAMLEGGAGMGKTRLGSELIKYAMAEKILALRGTCPDSGTLPFAPLREALENLLRSAFALPHAERAQLQRRVRDAAGDTAPLLKRFSPLLAVVLGDVQDLPGQEDVQDQFYDALANLFLKLAIDGKGALMVIEDVYRLDDGSRQVLARLAARIASAPLFILLTTRSETSLESLIAELGSSLVQRLTLAPIPEGAMTKIVTEQLGHYHTAHDLAARIAMRCNGSPFAAKEYVRSLLDAGLLTPSWGRWHLDEDGLQRMDLPTGMVQLALHRLKSLDNRAKEVLKAAAIMGPRFDFDILANVFEDKEVVRRSITDAVGARLLELVEGGRYAFFHAEVRAHLLENLHPEEQRVLHQRTAEALEQTGNNESEHLYAIARHAAQGRVEQNRAWVIQTNLVAGVRALKEYAHELSYEFLNTAREHAGQSDQPLPRDLEESLAEVCTRTGRLAESIQHLESLIQKAETSLERGWLRAKLTQTQCANFYFEPAEREARLGFAELGMSFPRFKPFRLLACLYYWIRGLIAVHVLALKPRSEHGRKRLEVFSKLCEYSAIAAYFDSRPLDLLQAVLKGRWMAARLGRSPELTALSSQYAVVLAVGGMNNLARRTIDRAEKIAKDIGDRLALARAQLYKGFVWHLTGSSVEAESMARRSLEEHGEFLDGMHYVDACGDLVFNLLLRGYFKEAWSWIERQLPRLWFTVGEVRAKQGNPWAGTVLAALGRTTEGIEYQDNMLALCEQAPRTERYRWAEMLAYRVMFLLEQGETGDAVDRAIEEHRKLGLTPMLTAFHLRGFYVFQAYTRMEQVMRLEADERYPKVKLLKTALRELKRACTIPSMRAHALVIRAALHRFEGHHGAAGRLLDRADRFSRDIDSPWVNFEVARQRAYLLHEQGKRKASLREARKALELALDHGWVYRTRRIRKEFGLDALSTRSPISAVSSHQGSASSPATLNTARTASLQLERKLEALLQVSLAAASVLDPKEQARRALHEILRILGAERAFLFLCLEKGGEPQFQVGRDADGNDLGAPSDYSTKVLKTVTERRKPVVVSGPEEGVALGSDSIVGLNLRSILAAPIMVREHFSGVIYLDNRLARGVFDEKDLEILMAIGNHIAISLETARAAQLEIRVEAEAEKRRLAESLSEMSHSLSSSLDLYDVLDALLNGVTNMLDSDRASVFIIEDDTLRLARTKSKGGTEPREDPPLALAEDPLLFEVENSRRPVVVSDTRLDGRVVARNPPWLPSFIGVPLISKDRIAGILVLEHREQAGYGLAEAEVAFTFAGQAGIAIENARLFSEVRRLATTDELTGIFNRRHFFTLAE